jgi:soluble lytic murein transglycosylase-like protein
MATKPLPLSADLIAKARTAASKFGLDAALVCAVVEQESGWNPWAMRYEPLFFAKYVAPIYTASKITATEAYARGFSWGLMQVMGQVAREHGVTFLHLSQMCDPEANLSIGCENLYLNLKKADGDVERALLYWNGGKNLLYPKQVLARVARYRV